MVVEKPVKLGIIGAGNVFRSMVRPALQVVEGNEIAWIADIKRKEEISKEFPDIHMDKLYHQLPADRPEGLPSSNVDVVLDLTPHEFHAHNLGIIFEAGKAAYIEKPFAISREEIAATSELLSRYPNQLAYFATYYRDEKGLGLRALTGEITQDSWYAQFLKPGVDPRLPKVLDSIGDFEYIVGTCLEGPKYGSIVGRESLCDKETGGMALDLGDHVFSFLVLLRDRVGRMTVDSARAGVSTEARDHYFKMTGKSETAEMYFDVSMRGEKGFPMRFALGKYTGMDEWGFYIRGKSGYVYLNLDSKKRTMDVKSPAFTGQIKVQTIADTKYTIMMSDVLRRVTDSALSHQPYGFENSSETLKLVLDIRDRFNQAPRFEFETGKIPGMQEIVESYRAHV